MMNLNDTAKFIVPMIANFEDKDETLPAGSQAFFFRPSFVGAYIKDVNKPEFDDKLLLYYKLDYSNDYLEFEQKLESLPNFNTDYDYSKNCMYVFDIPDQFKDDFDKFKKGKYSEFSDELKERITKFHNVISDNDLIYSVLYATPLIKDYLESNNIEVKSDTHEGETYPIPDLNNETFNSILFHKK